MTSQETFSNVFFQYVLELIQKMCLEHDFKDMSAFTGKQGSKHWPQVGIAKFAAAVVSSNIPRDWPYIFGKKLILCLCWEIGFRFNLGNAQ